MRYIFWSSWWGMDTNKPLVIWKIYQDETKSQPRIFTHCQWSSSQGLDLGGNLNMSLVGTKEMMIFKVNAFSPHFQFSDVYFLDFRPLLKNWSQTKTNNFVTSFTTLSIEFIHHFPNEPWSISGEQHDHMLNDGLQIVGFFNIVRTMRSNTPAS